MPKKYANVKSKTSFGSVFRSHCKSEINRIKTDTLALKNYIFPIKGSKTYTWWDCKPFKAKVY